MSVLALTSPTHGGWQDSKGDSGYLWNGEKGAGCMGHTQIKKMFLQLHVSCLQYCADCLFSSCPTLMSKQLSFTHVHEPVKCQTLADTITGCVSTAHTKHRSCQNFVYKVTKKCAFDGASAMLW